MRLHELAKELDANSKDLLKIAKDMGMAVKSHSSNLAPGQVSLLRAAYLYADADEETLLQKIEDQAAERQRREEDEKKAHQEKGQKLRIELAEGGEVLAAEAPVGVEVAGVARDSSLVGAGIGAGPEAAEPAARTPELGAAVATADAGVAGLAGEVSRGRPDHLTDVASGLATAAPEARRGTVPAGEAGTELVSREEESLVPEAVAEAEDALSTVPISPEGELEVAPERRSGADLDSSLAVARPPAGVTAARPGAPAGMPDEKLAPKTAEPPGARPEKVKPRRGARIVGRIDLPGPEQPGRSVDRHAAEAPVASAGISTRDTTREAGERERERGRPRSRSKPRKWEPGAVDEPAGPLGPPATAVGERPKFWERGPQRRPTRRAAGGKAKVAQPAPAVVAKKVNVTAPISVKDLSQLLGIKAQDILFKFLMKGMKGININTVLEEEGIELVALEFDRDIEISETKGAEERFREQQETLAIGEVSGESQPRAPVVTFLGHVDHGKTSLLDRIREANVAAGEAGGITQHISAYRVQTAAGQRITFLDTPGHRAFTEMRMRGAQITDIVVLVVAADDGVMPQTEEAYQHARAAGPDLPIVVALNKMDKPEANPQRVKQQLATLGLLAEEFGGQTGIVPVSALTGRGIDALLERIALEAELRELKANPAKAAEGRVIEAAKSQEIGIAATVLVRDGTLRIGDNFLCGKSQGKVRAMYDDRGQTLGEAGPSDPVLVTGFDEVPQAGDEFVVVKDLKRIRDVVEERREKARAAALQERQKVTLENLSQILATAGTVREITLVLKSDVQGTLEVVRREIESLKHSEIKVKVIRDGLGGITEDDVVLAKASSGIVVGFNVVPDEKGRQLADDREVEIRTYQVIYELIDDMKKAMEGALKPVEKETVTGHAEVRQVFRISKIGSVAGCYVTDGVVRRASRVRLVREGRIIYSGQLESLRRLKDDVRDVKEGFECGMKIAGYDDIKESDVIEAYEIVTHKRDVDWEKEAAE
ncbi:MAG: translation initiation factor IF-2 [Planctomycetota bacterium]